MKVAVLAGFFMFLVFSATLTASANAETPNLQGTNNLQALPFKLEGIATTDLKVSVAAVVVKPPEPKPQPVLHEVGANESLTTIASQYNTTWNRLYNKNEQIANPELITVGDKLTIPLPDETLVERALPEPPAPVQIPVPVVTKAKINRASAVANDSAVNAGVSRGTSSGNTYSPGYCTWYAKNMRPDLPNNLGNANTWVARAAAQGLSTGSAPRVGAIGQQGMHVVYVQSVNIDGTVTISEMNYGGLYKIGTRTVPASIFQYIY